ncbi:hypothetical protein [Nocardia tengchongensis]|uniref:hypothetical protein n=1 Tax=Nocardia tengchongensis TaxID=2055889 RepID=UPI0036BA4E2E
MPKVDNRAKLRGTLAIAMLFAGLAAAKGAAVANPITPQPAAPIATETSTPYVGSAAGVSTGSAAIDNILHACWLICTQPGIGAGVG